MVVLSVWLSPFLRVASLTRKKVLNLLQVPGERLIVPLFANQDRLMSMAIIQMQTALTIQLRSKKAKEAALTAFLFDHYRDAQLCDCLHQ